MAKIGFTARTRRVQMFIAKQPGGGNATPSGSYLLSHNFFYKHAIPSGLENKTATKKNN
jgi:hypothetical protein